jgi:NAD(P)-dependent dehydrogenase (short-subunit alcohol dehydrogenase family)
VVCNRNVCRGFERSITIIWWIWHHKRFSTTKILKRRSRSHNIRISYRLSQILCFTNAIGVKGGDFLNEHVMKLCFDIKGQTAIVTGASSGLGVTFAETLAELGVNLVIAARRYEKLVKVAEEIKNKFNVEVIPIKTDVSQEDQVINMVKTAVDRFESIEILVNNAGIASLSPSVDISLEEWKKVIDINLTGVFICARTAAREMVQKKYGKIINIASIYGAVGDVFPTAPYYASKGAVINLTRALAIEWAPYKINVNAIAPGFFPSEMTQPIFQDEKIRQYILSRTPLGRIGEPLDLKAALTYLASPASNYVTGQTIFVDGGWTAL